MIAIEAHQRNMVCSLSELIKANLLTYLFQPIAVRNALREANVDISKDIDGIAFTRGPGWSASVYFDFDLMNIRYGRVPECWIKCCKNPGFCT